METDRRGRPLPGLAAILTAMTLGITHSAFPAAQNSNTDAYAFLRAAAEDQRLEISLGHLAVKRAADDRVKDIAAEIVEDHTKASEQLDLVAMQEGVALSAELSPEGRRTFELLSQFSGRAFDREYMQYLVRHHEETVAAFDQWLKHSHDPRVSHWVISAVPLLEIHRVRARLVEHTLRTNP